MLNPLIQREEAAKGIFTGNVSTDEGFLIPNAPIKDYCGYLEPAQDEKTVAAGDRLVEEMKKNRIADFEKSIAYCERNGAAIPTAWCMFPRSRS